MSENNSPLGRKSYIIIAVLLCVAGWLIAYSMGWPVPDFGRWWPCFAIIGGLASVLDFFIGTRKSISMTRGLIGIGIGVYLLFLTTGVFEWRDIKGQWPILLLVISIAGLSGWFAAGMRGVPSGVLGFLALGFFFTAAHANWEVGWTPPPTVIWALILIAIAFVVFRGKKRAPKAVVGESLNQDQVE